MRGCFTMCCSYKFKLFNSGCAPQWMNLGLRKLGNHRILFLFTFHTTSQLFSSSSAGEGLPSASGNKTQWAVMLHAWTWTLSSCFISALTRWPSVQHIHQSRTSFFVLDLPPAGLKQILAVALNSVTPSTRVEKLGLSSSSEDHGKITS